MLSHLHTSRAPRRVLLAACLALAARFTFPQLELGLLPQRLKLSH